MFSLSLWMSLAPRHRVNIRKRAPGMYYPGKTVQHPNREEGMNFISGHSTLINEPTRPKQCNAGTSAAESVSTLEKPIYISGKKATSWCAVRLNFSVCLAKRIFFSTYLWRYKNAGKTDGRNPKVRALCSDLMPSHHKTKQGDWGFPQIIKYHRHRQTVPTENCT